MTSAATWQRLKARQEELRQRMLTEEMDPDTNQEVFDEWDSIERRLRADNG